MSLNPCKGPLEEEDYYYCYCYCCYCIHGTEEEVETLNHFKATERGSDGGGREPH